MNREKTNGEGTSLFPTTHKHHPHSSFVPREQAVVSFTLRQKDTNYTSLHKYTHKDTHIYSIS